MDKRIIKSKRAIEEAFVHLMGEKDFEQITINAIAERAFVNRGTVYLHYADKYDLLDKCVEREIEELLRYCSVDNTEDSSPKLSLLQSFHYMGRSTFFYNILLTNNGTGAFREKLQNVIRESLLKSNLGYKSEPDGILIVFWSSAIMGVIEWWIRNDKPCSAEAVTDRLWNMLEQNNIILSHDM